MGSRTTPRTSERARHTHRGQLPHWCSFREASGRALTKPNMVAGLLVLAMAALAMPRAALAQAGKFAGASALNGEGATLENARAAAAKAATSLADTPQREPHDNNWAVIVCTSRFYFNYRHVANTLSIYHTVKRLGMPDSHIILMLADDMPCNARNPFPGQCFAEKAHDDDLYGEDVQVDYRGSEVSVANFLAVMTGRHEPGVPPSKRLLPDEGSNLLVYLSGHGGDGFLKFQDYEEISSPDIADAVAEMKAKGRFKELMLIVDTCQAATLAENLATPGVAFIGSSVRNQNSLSDTSDKEVGTALVDRMTKEIMAFIASKNLRRGQKSKATMHQLMRALTYQKLKSTANMRGDLLGRRFKDVPISDFFTTVSRVHVSGDMYPLTLVESVDDEDDNAWEVDALAHWLGRVDTDAALQNVSAEAKATQPGGGASNEIDLQSLLVCGCVVAVGVGAWLLDLVQHKTDESAAAAGPAGVEPSAFTRGWVPFLRMDGAGNDFVVLDARSSVEHAKGLVPAACRAIADRNRGVGADQLIVLTQTGKRAEEIGVRFVNSDGTDSGACGNGTRAAALAVMHMDAEKTEADFFAGLGPSIVDSGTATVVTAEPRRLPCRLLPKPELPNSPVGLRPGGVGELPAAIVAPGTTQETDRSRVNADAQCRALGWVEVQMGSPNLSHDSIPLSRDFDDRSSGTVSLDTRELSAAVGEEAVKTLGSDHEDVLTLYCSNFGNPHAVMFVSDVANVDVSVVGAHLTSHELFPEGANISFVQVKEPSEDDGEWSGPQLLVRFFERGVGETLACGSAACAVSVAAVRSGVAQHGDDILLWARGGPLLLKWTAGAGSGAGSVTLAGPARLQFHGELRLVPSSGSGASKVRCVWHEVVGE